MLLHIGILGDFDSGLRTHQATNRALRHAADALRLDVSANWLPTPSLLQPETMELLAAQHAIFASAGSPYRSAEGMLAGIEFARRSNIPFLGSCGGFQYTLLEFARNVLDLADADSQENGDASMNLIITPVTCPVAERAAGAPKLSGRCKLNVKSGSRLEQIYGVHSITEEYFCNFEVNPRYVPAFENARLRFTAFGEHGEVRALELADHPFFVATLFQPQLSSEEARPHPLIMAYLKAAAATVNPLASHLLPGLAAR